MKGLIILDKNKKQNKTELPDIDILQISSSGDCTGLIPAGVKDEQQLEEYQEMYNFLPPNSFDTNEKNNKS